MQNQNSDLHNKKRGGMGENERVTEKEQEKIHMSPHLLRASMSASYIILLHNKSENLTSQLNESTGKLQYYKQQMRFPGLISKVRRHRRSSRDRDPGGSIKIPAPPNSNLKEWWTRILPWISRVRVLEICWGRTISKCQGKSTWGHQ